VYNSQANDEYEVSRVGVRGGFNLNPKTWLGAEYTRSTIKQNPKPVRALEIPGDYDLDYIWENSAIDTDVLIGARAKREDLRLRLAHRFDSGASLAGSIGLARFRMRNDESWEYSRDYWDENDRGRDKTEVIADLSYSWFPSDTVGMSAYYAHDILSMAYRMLTTDTVGLNATWKVSDAWRARLRGQYSLYADDNAMYQFVADSFWEVYPEHGFWFGLEYAMATTSDYNPYYWTPYWDERASAIFRYAQAWPGYAFNIDLIFGRQREGARPQEYNEWSIFYGDSIDWANAWGLASTYRQQFLKHWELMIDIRTMFLRSYADHSFYLSLDYTF